jgi:predicted transcriptional regulator
LTEPNVLTTIDFIILTALRIVSKQNKPIYLNTIVLEMKRKKHIRDNPYVQKHLKQLIELGYVSLSGSIYSLTVAGSNLLYDIEERLRTVK